MCVYVRARSYVCLCVCARARTCVVVLERGHAVDSMDHARGHGRGDIIHGVGERQRMAGRGEGGGEVGANLQARLCYRDPDSSGGSTDLVYKSVGGSHTMCGHSVQLGKHLHTPFLGPVLSLTYFSKIT